MDRPSEPIFNVPTIVLAIVAVFVLVWGGELFLLSDEEDIAFINAFAFIPARYGGLASGPAGVAGGWGPAVWSFVTYAFLHGSALHIGANSIFFLPFGSAVARRFGTLRFMVFFAAAAAAGALVHLATHNGDVHPMIGASAAVSGFMAGAIRFAFQQGGPVAMFRSPDPAAYQVPAMPLATALRDVRVIVFVVGWSFANLAFGIGALSLGGEEQNIAWEAHFGGFAVGFLLFRWFDPVTSVPA